ncbi:MAG TPA: hypothetical protein VIL30_02410 [Ramlibacter sp.]
MNVQWNELTEVQQQALRFFSAGQQTQVQREIEEQLRNLGLAERDGGTAKLSKIGKHLVPN